MVETFLVETPIISEKAEYKLIIETKIQVFYEGSRLGEI